MWKKLIEEKEIVVKYSILKIIIKSAVAAIVIQLASCYFLFHEFEDGLVVVKSLENVYDKGLAWDYMFELMPSIFIMAIIYNIGKYIVFPNTKLKKK